MAILIIGMWFYLNGKRPIMIHDKPQISQILQKHLITHAMVDALDDAYVVDLSSLAKVGKVRKRSFRDATFCHFDGSYH